MGVEDLAKLPAWEYFEAWDMNHGKNKEKVWAQLAQVCREPFVRQAKMIINLEEDCHV